MIKRFWGKLASEVPAYPLALFRILFGIILSYTFLKLSNPYYGIWHWVGRPFYEKYPLCLWIPEPTKWILSIVVYGGLLCSVFLTLGFLYRVSSFVLVILYGYYLFSNMNYFNNHYYLMWLFLVYFSITNAHHVWSLDSKIGVIAQNKRLPNWQLFLFQFQVLILFFYGGINKINTEWLSGYPVIYSLAIKGIVEPILSPLAIAMSWAGMLFDLLVGWFLYFGIYLKICFLSSMMFHLTNHWMYDDIGVFPFLGMGLLVLFIPSHYWIKEKIPKLGAQKISKKIIVGVAAICLFQVVFPFRHYFLSGDFRWTDEGGKFAWTMKSSARTMWITFFIVDPKTKKKQELEEFNTKITSHEIIQIIKKKILTENVVEVVDGKFIMRYAGKEIDINRLDEYEYKLKTRKYARRDLVDLYSVWRAALFIEKKYKKMGIKDPIITVEFIKSINAHPPERVIDPNLDLTKVKYSLWRHNEWILPHSVLDY